MEVSVLDSFRRREKVVDRFESLIWTERFSEIGDFELTMRSTNESRSLFKPGVQLGMNESYRVMTVETVENSVDNDRKATLKIKGSSIESIMDDRVAKESMSDLTTKPKWKITGTPAAVARKIFHDICVTGVLSPYDKIPNIVEASIMPNDTLTEPIDPITVELDPQSVYKAIKDICDVWGMGFRLVHNLNTPQLYWDVYMGSDRTTGQKILPPVIFSPDLDNLQNTTELNSSAGAKNVAYVFSPAGFLVVYAADASPDTDGFERRVMTVNADDITSDNTNVQAALLQRGKEELSKARMLQAFDGEINQRSQYKYQRDYYLGDLVEMRNVDGATNQMRVTEQIFVSDKEGDRAYPTLSLNTFINTGSWLSWQSNVTWADLDADPTTWADQP